MTIRSTSSRLDLVLRRGKGSRTGSGLSFARIAFRMRVRTRERWYRQFLV
jgi:hypothetical protein